MFPCDQWLSAEKEDGRTDRVLHISSSEQFVSSNFLLQNNIKRKLFDDHLWLSIGCRKTRSTFTRVQRLSCCWAILFLTMVSNAMWYGTGDETNSNQTAFEIGLIKLTTQQLYTSIMSSLVVLPPVLIISIIFVKSSGRKKKISVSNRHPHLGQGTIMNVSKPTDNRQFERRLPFWCILIAYVLVLTSVVCGSFFTVLYAFQWGKEKSEEWLGTFMLSFVQSVFLIQPVKVKEMIMLNKTSSSDITSKSNIKLFQFFLQRCYLMVFTFLCNAYEVISSCICYNLYYLHQAGISFMTICLFLCLPVCIFSWGFCFFLLAGLCNNNN